MFPMYNNILRSDLNLYSNLWIGKIMFDILFNTHDAFLEQISSSTLKAQIFESQLIYRLNQLGPKQDSQNRQKSHKPPESENLSFNNNYMIQELYISIKIYLINHVSVLIIDPPWNRFRSHASSCLLGCFRLYSCPVTTKYPRDK